MSNISQSGTVTKTLPKAHSSSNYSCLRTIQTSTSSAINATYLAYSSKTTSSVTYSAHEYFSTCNIMTVGY